MRRLLAFGLDLAAVAAFVVIGRQSHTGDPSGDSLLTVLAPFVIGLAGAWLVILLAGARAEGWRGGLTAWLLTLSLGMALRATVFGGGVAVSFVVVAGTFLALTMLGWRLVAQLVSRRRRGQDRSATPAESASS